MKTPLIKLHRYSQDQNQSLSTTVILDDSNNPLYSSITLERGWRNNKQGESCIPAGVYDVVLEYSPKFKKDLWEIKNVPNRSECKFHSANYWHQLNGCIAPGRRPKYLNSDKYLDVTDSVNTLKDFHAALKGFTKAILIITTEPNIF
ncbi:DUF5675 family protein [Lutibacter sp.]|uniref:DUF5675 family protein n=1 Tax=Lutibacter sp. TaxID=1925666 RepID=UPI0035618878